MNILAARILVQIREIFRINRDRWKVSDSPSETKSPRDLQYLCLRRL